MNILQGRSGQILLALMLSTMSAMAHANETILPGAKPSSTQRYQFWGFEIYDARLWTSPGFSVQQYTASPFVLELSYLRNFEGAAIAKRSMDEMRKLGSINAAQEKEWLKAMTDIFPNVRPGDRLMGYYKPNEGAEFWFQQKRLGVIVDPQFAKLFFGIWLHEATQAPAIRQAWINGL